MIDQIATAALLFSLGVASGWVAYTMADAMIDLVGMIRAKLNQKTRPKRKNL